MENEVIRIQTGNTDIWLLYSALTEVHRKEGLILFFRAEGILGHTGAGPGRGSGGAGMVQMPEDKMFGEQG